MKKALKVTGYIVLATFVLTFCAVSTATVFYGIGVCINENGKISYEIGGYPGRLYVAVYRTRIISVPARVNEPWVKK